MRINLKTYKPHQKQIDFHYALDKMYRFLAMICGIRGGKTYAGARQALKMAWNAQEDGTFLVIAPTYHMLKRTTWQAILKASEPLIKEHSNSDKIIVLKNGARIHGHSAEHPDRIRNETATGFWVDEARECKDFAKLWDVLLGRVLSTGGKGFITTSPNSFDDIHKIFIEDQHEEYGVIRFSTYENKYLNKKAIDQLVGLYDEKFAQQEIYGDFVLFEGSVYYGFNRLLNAGDYALKIAQYDPNKQINLSCDFNVDPMCFVLSQYGTNSKGLKEVYFIDEIYIPSSNTVQACQEFKRRYPDHSSGIVLYGDATGRARHSSSNVTNWTIIQNELGHYNIHTRVPVSNPAERDRINAMNGMLCNANGDRRIHVNPKKCKNLIKDFEQVAFKSGTTQIDKAKDHRLTHLSDAAGYQIEYDFSLNKGRITGLRI